MKDGSLVGMQELIYFEWIGVYNPIAVQQVMFKC